VLKLKSIECVVLAHLRIISRSLASAVDEVEGEGVHVMRWYLSECHHLCKKFGGNGGDVHHEGAEVVYTS
jgi:hypothetical protein